MTAKRKERKKKEEKKPGHKGHSAETGLWMERKKYQHVGLVRCRDVLSCARARGGAA